MGRVMIQNYTCKNPITMIGFEAGICPVALLFEFDEGIGGDRFDLRHDPVGPFLFDHTTQLTAV